MSADSRKIIELPEPMTSGAISLEETIARRRSVRSYLPTELTAAELGQILWAAQGLTDERYAFRAAPSAGALYPLEIYVLQSSGVFHYLPMRHALEQLSEEDLRAELAVVALGQEFVAQAPLDIVIAANYARTAAKYGPRAELYVHMEMGHVGQNIHLQAVALGLDSVAVGAFHHDRAARPLPALKGSEPRYIISVGHASSG